LTGQEVISVEVAMGAWLEAGTHVPGGWSDRDRLIHTRLEKRLQSKSARLYLEINALVKRTILKVIDLVCHFEQVQWLAVGRHHDGYAVSLSAVLVGGERLGLSREQVGILFRRVVASCLRSINYKSSSDSARNRLLTIRTSLVVDLDVQTSITHQHDDQAKDIHL
jgi:hypothetical protein